MMNLFWLVTDFMSRHVWAMLIGTAIYCVCAGWLARAALEAAREEDTREWLAEEVNREWQER